ncbi:hypothetical protein PG984_008050 [Apiospora sp. TS-2023a]
MAGETHQETDGEADGEMDEGPDGETHREMDGEVDGEMHLETPLGMPLEMPLETQLGTHHRVQFKRIVGQGVFGVTALLEDTAHNPPKRYIIKRALGADHVADLRKEIVALKQFRGAAHMTQMAGYRDDQETPDDQEAPNALSGLAGTSVITEYMENGTVWDLMRRVMEAQVQVPNRFLWFMMLCLIRACVGLLWPPQGDQDAATELEQVQPNVRPDAWSHNDMHLNNIMIGSLEPDVPEHALVPPFRLIDFGKCDTTEKPRYLPTDTDNADILQGQPGNMRKAAEAVMRLITGYCGKEPLDAADMAGIPTHAVPLWGPAAQQQFPWLDPELRRLIGRMMSVQFKDRPRLEEILNTAMAAALGRDTRDYPGREEAESNPSIRRFVQQMILDANAPVVI